MAKIAIGAGHGLYTPGKRTPDDEREWSFNNVAVKSAIRHLEADGHKVIRLDDPTGKTDVPLSTRTNKANAAKADILISYHHNAFLGKWGGHTGTETYIYTDASANSLKLAEAVHPEVVKAYGLSNRGIKRANFHMVRESNMPAILIEGGYMDSSIDIKKMRNNDVLEAAGEAIADGVAAYYGKKCKSSAPKQKTKSTTTKSNNKSVVWVGTDDKGKRVESIYRGYDRLNFYDGPRWNKPNGTFGYGQGWIVDNMYRVDGSLMYRVQNSKGDLYYITASTKFVKVIDGSGNSNKKNTKSINQMADEVIEGKHGNGHEERRKSLGVSQSVYNKVRKEVNKRL